LKQYQFYQWSSSDVVKHFETSAELGLTQKKAEALLEKNGPNALSKRKNISAFEIFLRQFGNLFIWLLFVAAAISYFADGMLQALVLLFIIVINILLGFFQEYHAEKSMLDLARSYQANTSVIRDGKGRNIENEKIVVGDIIELSDGNKVPADLRLIKTESLTVDESALTGESLEVPKQTTACKIETALADRSNMVYAGTLIAAGHGRGVVVAVADQTEFGKIAGLVEVGEEKTHLEKEILYLAKVLGLIAIVLAAVIFIFGWRSNMPVWELSTFTIALLVGMVPESLPTAITLALSVGVSRMAQKKAIVRRLAVIEALGSVNVIATDKTGTLTKNELSLSAVYLAGKDLEKQSSHSAPATVDFLEKSLACTNVSSGDAVDRAIAASLAKNKKTQSKFKKITEIPFSSLKKFMAVTVKIGNRKYLIAKGAPEKIVQLCDCRKGEQLKILETTKELSSTGFKVLALAEKKLDAGASSTLRGLKFLGLMAFADEAGFGVKEAIEKTIAAGIRPIMITGDHLETAKAVANSVGFDASDDEIISGEELEHLNKKELAIALQKVKVFARVTPEDKINIVSALRENGYSVAVTGDGTNDAPALKKADVGISMGLRGTDIAKDASDIVLADDHYGTIVSAVEYGRTIHDNIRNVVTLLISGNFNEVTLIIIAFLFGLPVPLLTMQILWNNMVTENISGITLAFEKPSRSVLRQKPRPVNTNSLKKSIKYALALTVLSFILSLGLYLWGLNFSIAKARTLVFVFIIFVELGYAFSIRNREPIWRDFKGFFENKYLLVSAIIIIIIQLLIFTAPLAPVFGLVSLTLNESLTIVGFVIISFLVAELIKEFMVNREK